MRDNIKYVQVHKLDQTGNLHIKPVFNLDVIRIVKLMTMSVREGMKNTNRKKKLILNIN